MILPKGWKHDISAMAVFFSCVFGHRRERERLDWLIREFMAQPLSTHVLSMGSAQGSPPDFLP